MTIEIKTTSVEPLRHTFDNVARRLGADKPASRYLEAMYDLQPTANFHYRPYWDPDHALYDTGRTRIEMTDWYVFKDPRQFYYGTWTMARAKQQDAAERNFAFVEKRNLADTLESAWREKAARLLVPLRHLEYAANMNNCYVAAYGYGTAITQAAMFVGIDRLGIAQYLSRIGLMLDGGSAESLDAAKQDWMQAPVWQPLRRLAEDLMVTRDWFELLVAQDFVLDGILYPLVYDRFDRVLEQHSGSTISMLTEFMNEWFTETSRWVDMTLKTAAAESDANKAQLEQWMGHWVDRVAEALTPVAVEMLGSDAGAVMDELQTALAQRATKKCGLHVGEPAPAMAS
ncbi:aromatic/alkene monooxygenase hydroxylase subunit beta [Mangrovitalea sediminis]|uniref:aromatic/alkene monooxygenase hydroxylase subunit beta n=1 Tax=Mangrovitalea sediminis TaxID=1982043 RepID=UPI000BE5066F|nr:aromatic/alkene monooxygenase hydroxylase subunit beta [Mangrovitalea sediminis]